MQKGKKRFTRPRVVIASTIRKDSLEPSFNTSLSMNNNIKTTENEKFQFSEMIVELRSTAMQTVFPSSIHESGEPVTWDVDGEPAEVSFQELRSAVGKLAAASLLTELWVDSKRHDLSLCVSGA